MTPQDKKVGMQPTERFFNREWSWLRFNERVLEEAEDRANALLERLKFISIFSSNLDEFFMVRVAGLYRQLDAGIVRSGTDRRSPREQIDGIDDLVHQLVKRQEQALGELLAALVDEGIRVVGVEALADDDRVFARRYYDEVVYPVLTPMIVGPKHPFPTLQGGTLYLVVRLRERRQLKEPKKGGKDDKPRRRIGFVAVPRVLPRFLAIGSDSRRIAFVPLESILVDEMERIFSGYRVLKVSAIRVTRDADFALDEEATEDMRRAMAKKLLGRRHGAAVRMEHGARLEGKIRQQLERELELEVRQAYPQRGLMQQVDLMQIYARLRRPDLKDVELEPLRLPRGRARSVFSWIRQAPRLVHHPYHSFDPVAELVAEAADDPQVLAIKQTLYRTSGNSPVVRALTRAAEAGKQVTVVVELRARFDEAANIEWAQRLEQAGAHVVYGLVGFKTHSKALLVVRREPEGIRRYVHMGTGNYNDATARIYTDIGLLTADELFGEDISALFNVITGATQPPAWNKVVMSPTGMRKRLLHLIHREADTSARRSRGRIIAKMNSLEDGEVIDALYAASAAGVRIDLIVRGICCLRPGIPGLSEQIRVVSVVGRFLEHSRIFWFRNGGREELYLSSGDWMPRNLDRRIELMFPVEEPAHVHYVKSVLKQQLRDNVKARELQPDGCYRRAEAGRRRSVDSQLETYRLSEELLPAPEPLPARFVPLARGEKRGGS